jgi:hypothetical protein
MPELVSDTEVVELGRAGLLEITPASTVGELLSQQTSDEGVTTLWFEATMLGYPGWHWTVSVAQLPGEAPTVLEAELLPGDGALLAPDWVPWSDRLEDYKAAQAAIAAGELAAGGDASDDDDADDDDLDEHDDDDLGDDPDDGIDFESDDAAADEQLAGMPAPVGVDEQDEPDAEPDQDGPEPPAPVARKKRRKKEQ